MTRANNRKWPDLKLQKKKKNTQVGSIKFSQWLRLHWTPYAGICRFIHVAYRTTVLGEHLYSLNLQSRTWRYLSSNSRNNIQREVYRIFPFTWDGNRLSRAMWFGGNPWLQGAYEVKTAFVLFLLRRHYLHFRYLSTVVERRIQSATYAAKWSRFCSMKHLGL